MPTVSGAEDVERGAWRTPEKQALRDERRLCCVSGCGARAYRDHGGLRLCAMHEGRSRSGLLPKRVPRQ